MQMFCGTPDLDLDRGGEVQKQRIVIGAKPWNSVHPCILDKIRYWGCSCVLRDTPLVTGQRSQVARRHFYIFIVFALIGPLLSAKQAATTTGEPAQLSSFSEITVSLDFWFVDHYKAAANCGNPGLLLSYWGPPLISKLLFARRFASWQLACLCMCGDGRMRGAVMTYCRTTREIWSYEVMRVSPQKPVPTIKPAD